MRGPNRWAMVSRRLAYLRLSLVARSTRASRIAAILNVGVPGGCECVSGDTPFFGSSDKSRPVAIRDQPAGKLLKAIRIGRTKRLIEEVLKRGPLNLPCAFDRLAGAFQRRVHGAQDASDRGPFGGIQRHGAPDGA